MIISASGFIQEVGCETLNLFLICCYCMLLYCIIIFQFQNGAGDAIGVPYELGMQLHRLVKNFWGEVGWIWGGLVRFWRGIRTRYERE